MIAINMEMPKGCQECMYFRKHMFGNGLDYSYSCVLGATEFPMPWIRQMEERASDCPLVEIVTCKDCKHNGTSRCKCSLCDGEVYMSYNHPDFYCANAERREINESNN